MMSNTVILFTVLASFLVLAQVQTGTAVKVDFDQYLGEWRLIGMASKDTTALGSQCGWLNITGADSTLNLHNFVIHLQLEPEKDMIYENGKPPVFHYEVNGAPAFFKNLHFTVDPLSDTSEMMITVKNLFPTKFIQLMSLKKSTASEGAKSALRKRAEEENLEIKFVNPDDCQYGNY